MLVRFRVANFRSLRGEAELSFVATDSDDVIVRHTGVESGGKEIGIIPAVGVFGANASGKSNLLHALRTMRAGVLDSVASWARDRGVPREPFALDPSCRAETTLFEVDLLLPGGPRRDGPKVRYTYGFELSDHRVEAEWLHAYPKGTKQVWFDRDAERGRKGIHFPNENLRGAKEHLVEATRANALFLTVAATFDHPQLSPVHAWFRDNLLMVSSGDDVAKRAEFTIEQLTGKDDDPSYRRRVEALLRLADLGILGLDVDSARPTDQQVRLLHRGRDDKAVPMDLRSQESLGTHAWFAFVGPVLDRLDNGAVLVADELDSSLHPILAAEVIRLFQDPQSNPHGAQLLFTAHDATLLGNGAVGRPLSRDQVWITTKKSSGETELYPLTDARPRREENLERGYLRGRYGGVPRVTTGEMAREVAELVVGLA
ncbi:MAG TPA: ATP-binding protein [Actinokineospora sp.]|nr:ATP-binding protein [Actinokineospora sp.]